MGTSSSDSIELDLESSWFAKIYKSSDPLSNNELPNIFQFKDSRFNYELKGIWDPSSAESEKTHAKLPRINYYFIRFRRWLIP